MGCSGFKPSPAPLNDLKKSAATGHTVFVCINNMTGFLLIVLCVTVCVCVPVMIPWVPGRVASG